MGERRCHSCQFGPPAIVCAMCTEPQELEMSGRRWYSCWHSESAENPCPICHKEPQELAPRDVAPSTPAEHAPGGATSCDSELAAIRERLEIDAASYAGHTHDCPGFADRNALLRMVDELTVQFNAERQAYNACGRERDDLRAKLASTEPEWDATDGAHPCWWRGHDNGADGTAKLLGRVCRGELDDHYFGTGAVADTVCEIRKLQLAGVKLEAKLAATEQALSASEESRELEIANNAELKRIAVEAEAKLEQARKALSAQQDKMVQLADQLNDARAKLAEAESVLAAECKASAEHYERAETAEARVRELELSIKLIAAGNGNIRTENNR